MSSDDGPVVDAADQRRALFRPNRMVDHFRVMRLLGRGGMGEVYLARDTKLGRKVALKVIHPEQIGSKEAAEHFLFEARAMARFSHPNIVTVYAVGELAGSPYVALEFLEGQTLRQRIRQERPSIREAIRLVLAIANALEEAHKRNVLHRDLKPENALIARDGRLRVVDFGLAKIIPQKGGEAASYPDLPTDVSGVDEVRGTPAYMAPEQWMEQEPSEATDIWSLGVVLYELVAGKAPYQDSTIMELALKVCGPDPVPRIETSQEVPSSLLELTYHCLDKLPSARPPAREVAKVLNQLLSGAHSRSEGEDLPSPFRGLLSFSERHAEFFFGREAEVDAFIERMREQPVLPVVGPSGAGKSSFVQAGVVPRLREQGAWVVLLVRPGSNPFRALASRVLLGESGHPAETASGLPTVDVRQKGGLERHLSMAEETISAENQERLAEQLLTTPSLLNLMLHQTASKGSCRVLLVVDQLEEIYTLVDNDRTRRRFMQAICSAADDPQDPVRVVFTLRDDFMVRLAEGPEAREALSHVTVLRSPDPKNLEQTLTRPLETLGYAFDDPSLPGEMVSAVRDEPAALPLLQFVTRMLWDHRDAKDRKLLRSAYTAAGGVEGALARHADGVLEGLTPGQLDLAREMLLRLVTAEGTRRVLPREQVLEGLPEPARQVLGRLTLARLITVRRAQTSLEGDAELELAHESLVRTWARLGRWIEESHEDLAFLGDVTQAADLWARRGYRDEEVWQGDALHEAKRHVARCTTAVPNRVTRFLTAGDDKERRSMRRRRVRLAAGFVLLAAVAVAAVLVAFALSRKEHKARRRLAEVQREGARTARQRGDLLEARAKLRSSLETQDSPAARALWWSLQEEPLVWTKALGAFVYEVIISPDGKTVAAASQDRSIYLIDVKSLAMKVLRGHSDQVFSLAYSPDGQRLASGTWSGGVRIWEVKTGRHRSLEGHKAAVWSLCFSPDGERIASGAYDHTVQVWDTASGRRLQRLTGHTDRVRSVRFSPDGKRLVTASYDHTVRIWDAASGKQLVRLEGHTNRVYGALFTHDANHVISSSTDRTVRLWDLRHPGQHEVIVTHGEPVYGVTLSPDGKRLAFGSYDNRAYVWSLQRRKLERVLVGHTDQIYSITFSPDGKRLVSGSVDKTVRLWDPEAAVRPRVMVGHTSAVYGVGISPDGKLVASGAYDKTLRLWDTATGDERSVLEGHTGVIFNIRFRPDGKQLASSSLDKTIRLWDVKRGVEQRVLAGHKAGATDLVYTPDGRRLASSSWDKTVRVWDTETGAQQLVLEGHTDRVMALAMGKNGRDLFSGSTDKTIRRWDLQSGEQVGLLRGHKEGVYGVAVSPDGRRLVSAGLDKTLRVWDLESGKGRILDRLGHRVYWLAYHPDGKRFCAPISDGTARIYDVASGKHVTLHGHRSEVNFCTFSNDGKLIATTSDDGTLRLWDAATARPFWRAPLMLSSPPELHSHRGWVPLEPTAKTTRGQKWRRAVSDSTSSASVAGDTLCLLTNDGSLEHWDLEASIRRHRHKLPGLWRTVAVPGGCFALSNVPGKLRLQRSDQPLKIVAEGVSAISRDGDGLLAAREREVVVFDGTGAMKARHAADVGVWAMLRTRDWLVLGFKDGNIELRPVSAGVARPTFSFEKVPSSAVVRLLEGPMGTLIAGYANGVLGIWNLKNGARLHHIRLHGPVTHLLRREGKLYAATELGHSHVLDLSIFHTGYCDVLQNVWRQVPTVWEGGLPVVRPPPRRHRCRP